MTDLEILLLALLGTSGVISLVSFVAWFLWTNRGSEERPREVGKPRSHRS